MDTCGHLSQAHDCELGDLLVWLKADSRDGVRGARQLLSVSYQRFSRYVEVSVEQEPTVSTAALHLTWASTLSALSSKASCLFCFPAPLRVIAHDNRESLSLSLSLSSLALSLIGRIYISALSIYIYYNIYLSYIDISLL